MWLVLSCASWATCGCARSAEPVDVHSLAGEQRFAPGDDPAWAAPDWDDSAWRLATVPADWSRLGVPWFQTTGWYRVRFDRAAVNGLRAPALVVGRLDEADEVYLNGVRIGGEGVIGRWLAVPLGFPRLYRIPVELLRSDAPNVLAIRVLRVFTDGGITAGPFGVGEFADLRGDLLHRGRVRLAVEVVFLVLYVAVTTVVCFFMLGGVREPQHGWFVLAVLMGATTVFLESSLAHEWGWRNSWTERLHALLQLPMVVCFLRFAEHVFERRIAAWVWRVCWALLATCLVGTATVGSREAIAGLLTYVAVCVVTTAAVLRIGVDAVIRHVPDARVLLAGLVISFLIVVAELVRLFPEPVLAGVWVDNYGTLGLILCGVYVLGRRYHQTRLRLRDTSARILTAHEEERKRVARELHDGVGQSLQAIRLRLQMIEADTRRGQSDAEPLHELADETGRAIEELRRVAVDLRPAVLEHAGLAESLEMLGSQFAARTGLAVTVDADRSVAMPERVKDHLYRIAQEGLKNVERHAAARQVSIRLSALGRAVVLEIRDDGNGFDHSRREAAGGGLGLTTIRERAELLGGRAVVSSRPGQGTVVHVEAPSQA